MTSEEIVRNSSNHNDAESEGVVAILDVNVLAAVAADAAVR